MKKYIALTLIFLVSAASVVAEIKAIIDIPAKADGDTIAIFLSGDGGWRKIDKDIAKTMTEQGIYVVGVNCMSYFWKKKTPEQTAYDVSLLINKYIEKTNRKRIMIMGYSFGADIVPFIINRLPEQTRSNVMGGVLLGAASDAFFEVSANEWLGKIKGDYVTLPEILNIKDKPLLLINGDDDDLTMIHKLDPKKYEIVIIDGGHHFDGDYNKLAWIIINWHKKHSGKK